MEQADIDFINSAVPVEEHQAVLHDEDFSMGSDISSEELTLAQGEADQMEFSQDLELELEWHMAEMDITRESGPTYPHQLLQKKILLSSCHTAQKQTSCALGL